MEKEVFEQDLVEQGDFIRVFPIHLLFEREGDLPTAEALQEAAKDLLGETDIVSGKGGLISLAVKRCEVTYQDGEQVPAQVLMAEFNPFDPEKIDSLTRTQFWDCPESGSLLSRCRYEVTLCDFMSAGLPYQERCAMLTGWLETVLKFFPEALVVWVPSAWKLLTPERLMANPYEGAKRFLHYGVNARFFRIEGTEDMLVDTLGLYGIGLPDVQYHFHDLDPSAVVNHAYCVAAYLFDHNAPIQAGETIDGLREGEMDQDVQWKCQYEFSLVQPKRELMDICPGAYAAGRREP